MDGGAQQGGKHRADCVLAEAKFIGFGHLPQNLRLAHNHRIESGGDPIEMPHCLGVEVSIQVRLKFGARHAGRFGDEVDQRLKAIGVRDCVNLQAVARGQDRQFEQIGRTAVVTAAKARQRGLKRRR